MRCVRSRSPRVVGIVLAALVAAGAVSCKKKPDSPLESEKGWRVFAIDYGRSQRFRHSTMVADAPDGERVPAAWSAWLVSGPERAVLVDTGFASEKVAARWKVDGFEPVPRILARAGVSPAEITDVVLTHLHWDHAGNIAPYRRARVWVQRAEREWARELVDEQHPDKAGVRLADLEALDAVEKQGRLAAIEGDREIHPGLLVHVGGRHTAAIQWVEVRTARDVGTVVLTSDNAYLYENLERNVPIGSCYDRGANLRELSRMRSIVSNPRLLVPGHEPRVFDRFPGVADRIVEIR